MRFQIIRIDQVVETSPVTVPFETLIRYSKDLDPSVTKVTTPGRMGTAMWTWRVTYRNGELGSQGNTTPAKALGQDRLRPATEKPVASSAIVQKLNRSSEVPRLISHLGLLCGSRKKPRFNATGFRRSKSSGSVRNIVAMARALETSPVRNA